MIKYFQTTTLILFWAFCLMMIWSYLSYTFISRFSLGKVGAGSINLPALAIAPVLIIIFHAIGISLIYPVHLTSTLWEIFLAGVVPGLVLFIASGLAYQVSYCINHEWQYWQQKPFVLAERARGKYPQQSLRRLVIMKSMTDAGSRCLPWLFGELIVVEALFNAPGLGTAIWQYARRRDLALLSEVLFWLIIFYIVCTMINFHCHKWLGKRLATYN
ncbi:MAG: hypothetical protein CMP10_20515 [Zetaproteobacteria bacterium]|nr:hypothetical protein [Pseudobdellovibrionaceae bacterium]